MRYDDIAMKTITHPNVTADQADRLKALGAKYVIPQKTGDPYGWQFAESVEAEVRTILDEKPASLDVISIISVANIGYDPGTVYYSVTYRVGNGPEQSATLAALRAAAEGLMTRGMHVDAVAVRSYRAAQAAAEADFYKPVGDWGSRKKQVIA